MKMLQLESAVTVLRLSDLQRSYLPLTEQVAGHIGQSPHLILDVHGITLNSMLIGELLGLHRAFEERWQDHVHQIALVRVNPLTREVLQRVHLDEYLKVYDDLAQALDALLDNAAHATTPLDRAAQDNGSEEPSEPLIRPKAKPAS